MLLRTFYSFYKQRCISITNYSFYKSIYVPRTLKLMKCRSILKYICSNIDILNDLRNVIRCTLELRHVSDVWVSWIKCAFVACSRFYLFGGERYIIKSTIWSLNLKAVMPFLFGVKKDSLHITSLKSKHSLVVYFTRIFHL